MKINRSMGALLFAEGSVLGTAVHGMMGTKVSLVFISWLASFFLLLWWKERRQEQDDIIDEVERKLGGDK